MKTENETLLSLSKAMGENSAAMAKANATFLLALLSLLNDKGVLSAEQIDREYVGRLEKTYLEADGTDRAEQLESAYAFAMIGIIRNRLGLPPEG